MTARVNGCGKLAGMSMVVFPFKEEDPDVAAANLSIAARHLRVTHVVAVGAEKNELFRHLTSVARRSRGDSEVEVIVQDPIGDKRSGKGDGMNTAMRRFVETGIDRLHFYDADITNFDASWIDGAEEAADGGFETVRHYFPRASTDAMITWFITRPLFALAHPDSALWRIRQPLGGELLLTRPVVEELVSDELVAGWSDWGIDTILTYATVATGQPVFEHYVASGKQHALYGSLADLREMLHECFEAAVAIAGLPTPPRVEHRVGPAAPAAPAIAHKVGYDVEATIRLLTSPWSPAEEEAAGHLPGQLSEPLMANRAGRPTFSFLDASRWHTVLVTLLDRYRPEPGWRDLLFRLWVARVLAYTTTDALAGHARAMEKLEETVSAYAGLG